MKQSYSLLAAPFLLVASSAFAQDLVILAETLHTSGEDGVLTDAAIIIEDGKIDTNPWITHRVSMDEMIPQFDSFTRPETGVLKAIVEIDD